jgi:hypothetical protein
MVALRAIGMLFVVIALKQSSPRALNEQASNTDVSEFELFSELD